MPAVNTNRPEDERATSLKRLLFVIVAAALAYSGWWVYAAQSLRSDVEAWFDDQRADGWEADYDDLSVRGFPSRTDVTLTNPSFTAPDGAFEWSAPFLQMLTLSYRRGHVIIAWPDTQTLMTANGPAEILSQGLRASIVYQDDVILRSNLEAEVLNIVVPDQTIALAGVNAAIEKIEPLDATYRFALALDSVAAPDTPVTGSLVPDSTGALRTDATVTLSAPLTNASVTGDLPRLEALEYRNTQGRYGALVVNSTGEVSFDARGRASGEISVVAENWREALANAEANGVLPTGASDGMAEILGLIASLSGSREALDVTLGLNNGTVLIGPLPVGQIPPLTWP